MSDNLSVPSYLVKCSVPTLRGNLRNIQYSLEEGEDAETDEEEHGGGEAEREGDDGDGLPHRRPPLHHLLHERLQDAEGLRVSD